jgi:hypothetical protein
MEKLELDTKLLAGDPIEVWCEVPFEEKIQRNLVGKLYPLTLKEIKDVGISNYYTYVSIICADIDDIRKQLKIKDKISIFQFYVINSLVENDYMRLFLLSLSCFFREEVKFDKDFKLFYLGDFIEHRFIDESVFEDIKNIIKLQNHMKDIEEERPIFANKKAEEMWNQIQENQKKLQDIVKKHNNLPSIISGVAWKSRIGIDRIWSLTLYQLYDACERLGLIDEYDKTLNGIYAGTVDPKAIDLKKIDWTKIINN